ncbi:hypothetical protein GUITHDRAFT_105785 [Guillardia theta CCMP2712]|uniref:PDZ domain-containing protein n=1 Tax=Guillardia theta (strain CCMP2712) TaxID=905079 RepID=L1JKM2_GUITC|nr:hypothetical protein GUITHDRAFT_105785 [Guillardia theta CCMP2712]EKX48640.1 hypothetical protein GUITHDRAFT_105785 [Guillardia theta CCMP2712]|eukprot:XP_005835620.1 hypothetical protein GUITHDRAFT_105785 [Guillardia theta CCMP2712]
MSPFPSLLNSPQSGIGVKIEQRMPGVPHRIIGIDRDGPAFNYLQIGDDIYEVNGAPTTHLSVEQVAQLIRSAPGDQVQLLIARPGESAGVSRTQYNGAMSNGEIANRHTTSAAFLSIAGRESSDAFGRFKSANLAQSNIVSEHGELRPLPILPSEVNKQHSVTDWIFPSGPHPDEKIDRSQREPLTAEYSQDLHKKLSDIESENYRLAAECQRMEQSKSSIQLRSEALKQETEMKKNRDKEWYTQDANSSIVFLDLQGKTHWIPHSLKAHLLLIAASSPEEIPEAYHEGALARTEIAPSVYKWTYAKRPYWAYPDWSSVSSSFVANLPPTAPEDNVFNKTIQGESWNKVESLMPPPSGINYC